MPIPDRRFLIFSLQGSLYALDLAHVAEVSDPPPMWPIPLAPACYSGALGSHGDVVAVVNLSLLLGLPDAGSPGKMVLVRQEVASVAFLVDAVAKIISGDEVSIAPPPDSCFAAGALVLADGKAILLDLEALVHEAGMCLKRCV